MLRDLVRQAPRDDLLQSAEALRADHDHGRVQLVGDVDDAAPGRRVEIRARLCAKAGCSSELGSRRCPRERILVDEGVDPQRIRVDRDVVPGNRLDRANVEDYSPSSAEQQPGEGNGSAPIL